MKTKKELRELFTSFKGLNALKKLAKQKSCNGIGCYKCAIGKRNTNVYCTSIVRVHETCKEDVSTMKKLIDIFTEEKISRTLSLIDKRLKYNSKVVYNGKSYMIKGVVNKKKINIEEHILLNGFRESCCATYDDCIVKDADMKKKYTLWINVKDIEIKEMN